MKCRMQIRFILFCVIAAAFAGFCCGCAGGQEQGTAKALSEEALLLTIPRPREAEEEVVEYTPCAISFSCWGEEDMETAVTKSVAAFEQKYPGIVVEVSFDSSEGQEGTKEAFEAGTIPDVIQLKWEWLSENPAVTEICLDLYEADPVLDLYTIKQKYLDQCTVQGALCAAPVSAAGKLFLFQESVFESAGIKTPKTFRELREAGSVFRDVLGEEYYPLALTEKDRMLLLVTYLESTFGKQWVVDGEFQYKVEELQQGLEFLQLLEEEHVIPSLPQMDSGAEEGWKNGFYGGVFIWDNELEEYKGEMAAGQEGVVRIFSDLGIYQGGYARITVAYAVSDHCEHKREAALWLDFLLNQEEGVEGMDIVHGVPLSKAGRAYCLEKGFRDEAVVEANTAVLDAVSFPVQPELADVIDDALYHDALNGFSYGDYNAREAAQLLSDKIETALE